MFYAYDIKPGTTRTSSDHDPRLQRRKVPRLALSTDVKTPSTSQHFNSFPLPVSSYPEPSYMENDSPHSCHPGYPTVNGQSHANSRRRGAEDTDTGYGVECYSLDSADPALLPSSCYDSTTVACIAESPVKQLHHSSPSCPQDTRDTQADNIPYSHLRPTSFYPSPPHSTAVSPLQVFNPLPPPIQPPPSLPLHQPRPSRRIPIISLSQLASACDEFDTAPQRKPTTTHKSRIEIRSNSSYLYPAHAQESQYLKYGRHKQMPMASSFAQGDNRIGRFVQCSCGCMESYAVD